ncbi:hypothetical protein [Clostridium thermobutyricum]|uniref:hypothetical protein n=1 Tax=Clostridium thermobutyricum TaxID=29372 RepID=UPI003F524872
MKDKEYTLKLTKKEILRVLSCMYTEKYSDEFEEDIYFERAYKKLHKKIIKNK